MKEIFKPIKDFPNYEISNLGRVRSLPRKDVGINFNRFTKKYVALITVNGKSKSLGSFDTKDEAITAREKVVSTIRQEPKILAQTFNGQSRVSLYSKKTGRIKVLIKDLVIDAFFDRKDHLTIKHIDGDTSNNSVKNLKPLYSKESNTKKKMPTDVVIEATIAFNMSPAEIRFHCEYVINNDALLQKAKNRAREVKSDAKKQVMFYINEIIANIIEFDISDNISSAVNLCIQISIENGGLEQ